MSKVKRVYYLSGLPRSGSTLLANVLNSHEEIACSGSSCLCNVIQGMRRVWSSDVFFKAQLDNNYDKMVKKVREVSRSVIYEWGNEGKDIYIDKSRGWLYCLEWLKEIDPEFKMIITIRDLCDIYGSIEARHRESMMIEFPDGMEPNLVDVRANALFADGGVIGGPLKALYNIGDIPDIMKYLYICRYEDLVINPVGTFSSIFKFLGVKDLCIRDGDKVEQSLMESDSHYNMKYLHNIRGIISSHNSSNHKISPRIGAEIKKRHEWFYSNYYKDDIRSSILNDTDSISSSDKDSCGINAQVDNGNKVDNSKGIRYCSSGNLDESMIKQLEEMINEETKRYGNIKGS